MAGLYCRGEQSDTVTELELTDHIISQGGALIRAIEALETIEPSGWFERAVASGPDAKLVCVAEQVTIDQSESLVRLVLSHCETKENLGRKGKSSLLKSIAAPAAFLQDPAIGFRSCTQLRARLG